MGAWNLHAVDVTISAVDASASEAGSDTGIFRITRTDATGVLTVNFTVTGSATEGVDYPAIGTFVTMPDGQASADVIVAPVDDASIEGIETVQITLQSGAGYVVGTPSSATVNLADNDPPTVTIAATDPSASEPGADTGQFTLTRTGGTTGFLIVQVAITGTASNGSDYSSILTSITIPSGQAAVVVAVTPLDDFAVEGNETVVLTVQSNAAYIVGTPSSATVTIDDNERPTLTVLATDATAAEPGTDTGRFTFTRSGALGDDLVVNFTVSGVAVEGTDYVAIGTTQLIPAGSASATLSIIPLDDALYEGGETLVVTLAAGADYIVGDPSSGTVNINDNERSTVTVTAPDAAALEPGVNTGTFVLERSATVNGTYPGALVVNYALSGTATSATDYTSLGTTATIPDAQSSVTLTLTPLDDAAAEDPETAVLTLQSSSNYNIGAPPNATITLSDDDPPIITIAVADATGSEPGTDTARFTLTRSGAFGSPLTVNFTTGGTATAVTDYQSLGVAATFPATQASVTLTVTPVDDADYEGSETVVVTLAAGAGYLVGAANTASVTINDDDRPVVSIVATDDAAAEAGLDPGTYVLSRTATVYGTYPGSVAVALSFTGTALSGSDYTALATSATIPDGQPSVSLTVVPINDTTAEDPETVIATLGVGTGYSVGAPSSATVTIADNDLPVVTISVSDPSASEPGGDTGTFLITRSGRILVPLTVNINVSGTATEGTDYTALGNTVTIPVGELSIAAIVSPADDGAIEGSETVVLTLLGDAAYTVGTPGAAALTILDNDFPTITVTIPDAVTSEPGTDTGTFRFSRTVGFMGTFPGDVVVSFTTTGTATSSTDYTALPSSITIPNGQQSVDLVLAPRDDAIIEGPETVIVTLSNGAGYLVGLPNSATLTLADNDFPVVTITASDSKAAEPGTDTGAFVVKRVGGTTDLTVNFTITGTATANADFVGFPASVVIPAGQSQMLVTVTPVDDTLFDGNETVILTLVDAPGVYVGGATTTATVTINDDEKPEVDLVATDANASEPGTDTGTFRLSRSATVTGTYPGALQVTFTVAGTAKSGTDFTALATVTLPDGSASASLVVVPKDDVQIEGDETVVLTLKTSTAYNLGIDTATITIRDDDFPVVTIAATDAKASEPGTDKAILTLTRSGGTTDLFIDLGFTGSATFEQDYAQLETTVKIPAASSSVTVEVTALDDTQIEGDEELIVTILAGTGYTLGSAKTATITIKDNDRANTPPEILSLTIAPNPAPAGQIVTFTTAASDAERDALTYLWDFGDGATIDSSTLDPLKDGDGTSVTHVYTAFGNYTVTLTVTDPYGGKAVQSLPVRVINSGDGRLYATKASFFINRQGPGTEGDYITDQLILSGFINPAGLPRNIAGATVKFSVNGVLLAPAQVLTPTGMGTAPNIAYRLSSKNGAFLFSVGGLDLAKILQVSNLSGSPPVVAKVEIQISNIPIETPIWTGDVEFISKSVENIVASGAFRYPKNRLLTGTFMPVKASAKPQGSGYTLVISGPMLATGSRPVVPDGDVVLTIDSREIRIPFGAFANESSVNAPPVISCSSSSAVVGLRSFVIDNVKKAFLISTDSLNDISIPAANPSAATTCRLPIQIEVPTAEGTWVFAATLELLRSKGSSPNWKR